MDPADVCEREFEIENFSCWNREIHGTRIECGNACLFPQGIRGDGEYLEVRLKEELFFRNSKLAFIDPDGSINTTAPCCWDGSFFLFDGPKFTDVVARIKEKKRLHRDRLILRWQSPKRHSEKYVFNRSILCAFDASGKISSPSSSNNPQKDVSGYPNALGPNQAENALTVLSKDIMCLYQDHDFSDFELRCGTVSFPTHRAILAARSAVFKAMLSGDMREAASGHVDVEDLDPHTLGRLLAFLYSGDPGGEALGWEEASKLYYAADKYKVPSLKDEWSPCAV